MSRDVLIRRTSSSASVRVERIEKVPKFDAAFDYLTSFYKVKNLNRKSRNVSDAAEIDLTGDDDSTMGYKGDDEDCHGAEGGLGLASGVPCETWLS